MTTTPTADLPQRVDADQLARLLELRDLLQDEQEVAMSPAVARSLEMADYYLFLALGYFGYAERLFPEQK